MAESAISSGWTTTIVLVVSVAALLYELARRRWFSFKDDVPVIWGLPFINRPPADRIRDSHDFEKEVGVLVSVAVERSSPCLGPRRPPQLLPYLATISHCSVFHVILRLQITWKYNRVVMRYISPLKPWRRTVLIGDPALLKDIYVGAKWEAYDRGHPYQDSMQEHAGGLILIKNGQRWRDAREALGNKTFSSTTLRTYVPLLREQFQIMVGVIEKERVKGGKNEVDLQEIYSNVTFDFITRLTFGDSVKAQTSKEGHEYLEAWDNVLGLANILSLLQGLADKWIWNLFPKIVNTHKRDVAKIKSIIEKNLERRKRGEDLDRVSILDDLFRNEKAASWLKEDEEELKKQLMTLLFAGHDVGFDLFMRVESSLTGNQTISRPPRLCFRSSPTSWRPTQSGKKRSAGKSSTRSAPTSTSSSPTSTSSKACPLSTLASRKLSACTLRLRSVPAV